MEGAFLHVLAVSLTTSAVLLPLLLLLPRIRSRYAAKSCYVLWLLLALRLLIPVDLSLPQAPIQVKTEPYQAALPTAAAGKQSPPVPAADAPSGVREQDGGLSPSGMSLTGILAAAWLSGAAAFLLGAYVIWIAGWIPLAIGAAGAVVVVLYSAGKTPISYLPIGELVSGFVMGGLIPLACYQALSGTFDLRALLWAVPTILGVGLIMFTNNTCDVEKDVESGRRTLSVLLGRERARKLYHGVVYAWVAAIVVLVAAFFTNGLLVMPFMLLASYPLLKALLGNPLAPQARIGAMAQVCSANIALGAFYAAAILASGIAVAL